MNHFKTFFLIISILFSGQTLFAQDCTTDSYGLFQNGAIREMTSYDHKDRVQGVSQIEIMDVEPTDDGLKAVVNSILKDDKGEVVMEGEYEFFCEGGTMRVDVSNMINSQFLDSYKNMNITMEGDMMEIPSNLEVGQTLPDATTTLSMGGEGANFMNITYTLTDREVTGKETVDTPLGPKEGYVVKHTFEMKTIMKKTYLVEEVYVKGIGPVESRTYNKKGKLQGVTRLTKLDL